MKPRILIADDERDVVDLVRNRLELKDYEVLSAYDGQEALDKIRSEKPDLIVLDIMMPLKSGYEVCNQIKQDRELSHIPILMLTAKIKYADKKIAECCGADAYIPKPYSSDLLLETIEKFLK